MEQVFGVQTTSSVRTESRSIDPTRLAALQAAELGRFCGSKIGKMKALPSIRPAVRASLLAVAFWRGDKSPDFVEKRVSGSPPLCINLTHWVPRLSN